jgi:HupE / UreJ protein
MKIKLRNRYWYWWLCIFSFIGAFLISLSPAPSYAHWADLSVAEITVEKTQTEIILTFPTVLVSSADDDRNGQLSTNEIANHKIELEKLLSSRIRLVNQKEQEGKISIAPSNNLPSNIQSNDKTHTTLELNYTWSEPVDGLKIDYNFFLPNAPTAHCLATVIQEGRTQNLVFTPEKREFSLTNSSLWQQVVSFVLLGIEHILTGYDHVLFIISLLMLGGGFGYLLKVVTAFTIAHSVTLSLAVLNIVSLPVIFVESAIALTIVYVALENFWRKNTRGRWLLTFVFGLIHGLGFAGVLREINISQSNLFVSLASFNIGVEIGQIFIVSIAFLAFRALRKQPWELTFRRLVSAGVVAVGLFWFVQRAFGLFA